MSTDGIDIYSYGLRIGTTIDKRIKGKKYKGKVGILYCSYTRRNEGFLKLKVNSNKDIGKFVSMTTSLHVYLVLSLSDHTMSPFPIKKLPPKVCLYFGHLFFPVGEIDGNTIFKKISYEHLTSMEI